MNNSNIAQRDRKCILFWVFRGLALKRTSLLHSMLLPLQGSTKPLHEGKILSDLRFQLCNRDATVHMIL